MSRKLAVIAAVTLAAVAFLALWLHSRYNSPVVSEKACMVAMVGQIKASESHPGPATQNVPLPSECNGLSDAQVHEAAVQAVIATMPQVPL